MLDRQQHQSVNTMKPGLDASRSAHIRYANPSASRFAGGAAKPFNSRRDWS